MAARKKPTVPVEMEVFQTGTRVGVRLWGTLQPEQFHSIGAEVSASRPVGPDGRETAWPIRSRPHTPTEPCDKRRV